MILDHPITHSNQQFICPSDAAVNDDVGQVTRGLVTHADFFFQRWGIQLVDSNYKCQIESGNSDGAFSINSDTGDLKIAIPGSFTATRSLTIRVYIAQYPWYYMDTTCEILYIPAADCIYFDVDFVGTSDGSRSNPYNKYSENVFGGASWGLTSIPGKTFLWRRGKTWTNEWTTTNTGTNEATLPIRFGAWGQGVRPIIDLSLNSTSERFAQVGLASMSGPAEDFKMSNNIYYYDFDITHDNSNDAYPVQVVPMGRFIEFHRMKMTNCTFPEGFMWFAGPFAYPYVDRNILIRDIFTYDHGIDTVGGGANDWPRAIKMETGGSTAENIYCETSKNYHSAAFSGGATRQNVTTKYVKAKINVSLSGELFGMEVRNVLQQHQWVVLDGVDYGLTIFGFKGQISGEEVVPDSTSGFSDVILKNIGVLDVTTINQTVLDMDGVYIKNVISEESSGVLIGGSTKCINTKLQNLLLTNSVTLSDAEIQVGSSGFQNQNGATIIENCLCGRIENFDNQTIVRNTIYDAIIETQTAVITTSLTPISAGDYKNANYEPTVSAAQLGAGTADAGLVIDLNGDLRPSPPAIGPYEYTNQTLANPNPPGSSVWRYKKLVLPQDYFGNLIYDTYQTSKAANGNFEVPFVQIKNLVNNVKDFGWDLLCVPFTNKDDIVYSMIGPNLSVTGGGNGSKVNRLGFMETELPNNRPRYNFNPDTGIFEGVYLEVEDTNLLDHSIDFTETFWSINNSNAIRSISGLFSPENLLNAYFSEKSGATLDVIFGNTFGLVDNTFYKSIFVRSSAGQGTVCVLKHNSVASAIVSVNETWQRIIMNYNTSEIGGTNFYVVDWRAASATLTEGIFYGAQVSQYNTSFIKTTGSSVTRSAETYTAPGAIVGTTYTIVKYTHENRIAYYYDSGNKTTYIDGVNTGMVAEAPINDFIIQSDGSEKVNLMGLIEGAKTNQELIDLTL